MKGVKEKQVENESDERLACVSAGSSALGVNDENIYLYASTITHSHRWSLHILLSSQRGWGHSLTHDDGLFLSVILAASCYHYSEAESEVSLGFHLQVCQRVTVYL